MERLVSVGFGPNGADIGTSKESINGVWFWFLATICAPTLMLIVYMLWKRFFGAPPNSSTGITAPLVPGVYDPDL